MDNSKHESKNIPKKLRESIWIRCNGEVFSALCYCCRETKITVFSFECGHDKARSKGGDIAPKNLVTLCSGCNKSMGTRTIVEFQELCGFEKINVNKQEESKISSHHDYVDKLFL